MTPDLELDLSSLVPKNEVVDSERVGIMIVSTGSDEVDTKLMKAMEILEPQYGKCIVVGEDTPDLHKCLVVGAVGNPGPDMARIIEEMNKNTIMYDGILIDDRKPNQPYYRKFDKHNKW